MSAFETAREEIRRTLIRMQAVRHLLELDLAQKETEPWRVLDAAAIFAGPGPEELRQAEEASESMEAAPGPRGKRWWDEEFAKNWPEGARRTNPGWTGRKR